MEPIRSRVEKTDFDLVVIGSGPGGQRAAFQAAKSGKKVALSRSTPKWVEAACIGERCPVNH